MVELHTHEVVTMQRAAEVLAALGRVSRRPILRPGGARWLRRTAPGSCPSSSGRWTTPPCRWRTSPASADARRSVPGPDRAHHPEAGRHEEACRRAWRTRVTRRLRHDHGNHTRRRRAGRAGAPAVNAGASFLVASRQVAARTLKKFVRTPALIVAGTAQGVLFLLIFRYVFGGADVSHRKLDLCRLPGPGVRGHRSPVPGDGRGERHGRRP